nr:uncharacterized protein LOC105849257 isoform X2 [Hydra vulgaris]
MKKECFINRIIMNSSRWKEKSEVKILYQNESIYFHCVSIFHYIFMIFSFMLFGFICFDDDDEFLKGIGGPGVRLLYLRKNYLVQLQVGFFFAVMMHIVEALYAFKICKELNIRSDMALKWFLQTFICGYISLRHLLEFKDQQKSKQK